MTIKRGEIYYADLSPVVGSEQGGIRPVFIPIVPDFMFVINGTADLQEFNLGELKSYVVVSKGVVSAGVISKPEGWEVTLLEDQLIVVAPDMKTIVVSPEPESKATADTNTDICVLAVSKSGHAVLSKVRVTLK